MNLIKNLEAARHLHGTQSAEQVKSRTQKFSKAFKVSSEQALTATLCFHDSYYLKQFMASTMPAMDPFEHYIANGLYANLVPGPFFDPVTVWDLLSAEKGVAPIAQGGSMAPALMLAWLANGGSKLGSPSPFFDEDQYLCDNPDVLAAGVDPFMHFLLHGNQEGRAPCKPLAALSSAMTLRGQVSSLPYSDLLALFPLSLRLEHLTEEIVQHATNFVVPDFIRAQEPDVASLDDESVVKFFWASGIFKGLRPSPLFNVAHYSVNLKAWIEKGSVSRPGPRYVLPPNVRDALMSSTGLEFPVAVPGSGDSAFLHWLVFGRPRKIVPTLLFDAAHYVSEHNDLINWSSWSFDHYVAHGIHEQPRSPSIYFCGAHYSKVLERYGWQAKSPSPLVDFLIAGDSAGVGPKSDMELSAFPAAIPLSEGSRLEAAALEINAKIQRLTESSMVDVIARAAAIEPMIMKPDGLRAVSYPPIKSGAARILIPARQIMSCLKRHSYDTIVLIPHCRMSGAAHVAGEMVRALVASRPSESLLLVHTDLSVFERPDWFGEGYERLDFARATLDLAPTARLTLLLDLVRGLSPRRVINVNSLLGWELFDVYARQIKSWTRLFAYIFCYDFDGEGNQVGYPIKWLQRSFDHLDGVFFDNTRLPLELTQRYSMSAAQQKKLHVLHTPEDFVDRDYSDNIPPQPKNGGRVRAFWAGRLDKQKNFDIVIEVARRMPELELWVYGKKVLGDVEYDLSSLPPNIRLEAPYLRIDDVPLEIFDFYLYTSLWDGLPSILIETGMRGLKIVSSIVGGIEDLITEETGWPVRDVHDPNAYCTAIKALTTSTKEASHRAARLRERVRELCNHTRYRSTLLKAIED